QIGALKKPVRQLSGTGALRWWKRTSEAREPRPGRGRRFVRANHERAPRPGCARKGATHPALALFRVRIRYIMSTQRGETRPRDPPRAGRFGATTLARALADRGRSQPACDERFVGGDAWSCSRAVTPAGGFGLRACQRGAPWWLHGVVRQAPPPLPPLGRREASRAARCAARTAANFWARSAAGAASWARTVAPSGLPSTIWRDSRPEGRLVGGTRRVRLGRRAIAFHRVPCCKAAAARVARQDVREGLARSGNWRY